MGAIVGVFALDDQPIASADVRRMAAQSQLPPSEPATGAGITVWFDGRLDNRDDLARLVRSSSFPLNETSDPVFVLAAYREYREEVARHLNGDFAFAIVDETRRCAVLARDVMASQPLYYCALPGVLLFASEIKCLLAHPGVTASIDEDALAELVLDYWCDAHRTCFKGIYSVPPGYAVVATGGRVDQRAQWTFDPMRQVRYRSFDDYRDHFRLLFEQAVRRRLRGSDRVAVQVSGGIDSSSVFCQAADLLRRESLPLTLHGVSMTFPAGTPADEQQFLDDIERQWQLSIARVPVSEYRYLDATGVVVRQLDTPGTLQREHVAMFETARSAGCHVLLSGFFGDQMLAEPTYFLDLARRWRWLRLRHDLRVFCAWTTDVETRVVLNDFWSRVVRDLPPRWLLRIAKRVVRRSRATARYPPWFTASFCQRAEARALTRFDQPRRSATAHADRYYLHATAGHYIDFVRCEVAAAKAHDVDVRYPFRDRDLIEFLMAIPGEIVNWQGVPKGLLRHALTGVLPDAVRDRRSKADFTAIENHAARRDAARIAAMLTPEAVSVRAGIVDAAAVDCVVSTNAGNTNDETGAMPGWRPIDLVGLELWLQQYFGDRQSPSGYLRDSATASGPLRAEVLEAARADGVHLLLATRMSVPSMAAELREAAVVEAVRARELRDVLGGLAAAGVHPVLLKGAALAYTHYPQPELRPRSDTDFMIPASARAETARVLGVLGYERPLEIEGDVAIGQFHCAKTDNYGLVHALDVHWRVSNVRAFAGVLSYEELARDAVAVQALGSHAFGASAVHALLVACIHRVAHHGDAPNLLWLYDVYLIARAMTPADRVAFAALASERRVLAVCTRTLTLARDAFGGIDADWLRSMSPVDFPREPTAAFVGGQLRQIDILKSDFVATRWPLRIRLLREHLFPPPSYMRQRFPQWPVMLLPVAYVCRVVGGAPRWLRR